MKKKFITRLRHDLFPKTPQSFIHQLRLALPTERTEQAPNQAEQPTERTTAEPIAQTNDHRQFWASFAIGATSVVVIFTVLFVIFGSVIRSIYPRNAGDLGAYSSPHEPDPVANSPEPGDPEAVGTEPSIVGTWTLWKIDYNGLIISASVSGTDMLYTIEFRDDGTADVRESYYISSKAYTYTLEDGTVTLSTENEDDVVLAYDAVADTLIKENDGKKLILHREQPEDPLMKDVVDTWSHVTGLDMEIDITIRNDGTASVVGWRSNVELPFIYTVENGELQFTCVSEMTQRSFTARYDEERDLLSVTMDGTTTDYYRPKADVKGIWTLTGIEYNGIVTDWGSRVPQVAIYLAFSDDGVMTLSMFMGDACVSQRDRYLVTGNRIDLEAIDSEDAMLFSAPITDLTYDPQTDTLRLDYDTTTMAYDMALIFSRTPDAAIPEVENIGDAVGEWIYQFKPDYLLYVTVESNGTARLKIMDGGETKQDMRYIYKVEDGTIRFTFADEDSFTATYEKDTDMLTVTLNDVSMPFMRIWRQYVGKWTMAGVEKQGSDGEPYIMSSAARIFAEFREDGTVTLTCIYADSGMRETYRYTATSDGLIELHDNAGTVIDWFVYDEKEDRLRITGWEPDQPVVFMRTSNVQIPLLPGEEAKDVDSLRNIVPEYFGLEAVMGLKVYVWQMAEDDYSCALLSAADRKTDAEIGGMNGVTIEQMRLILSTYGVPSKRIEIVPFRNPLSSYWYEIDEAYTERITTLLKDDTQTIDAAVFDVDKDGSLETCVLENGPTAESRTVVFTIFRNGTVVYRNTFLLEPGRLQFVQGMNGQTWYITRTTVSMTDGSEVQADKITFWISDGRIRMQRSTWKEVEYWNANDPEWNMGFDSVPEE